MLLPIRIIRRIIGGKEDMPMTPKEMIKLLEKNGFNRVKRTNGGSHQKMYNPITNATNIVPLHTKALGKGLETAILKQAKLK